MVRDQGVGGSNPPCPKRGHRLCWCTTQSREEACFAPEMTLFQVFFRDECTSYRGKFGHSMCGFDQILYNSSRKSLWCKTAVRQSEHQSCQNLQYDRDIHGNYSTVGVPLLDGSTDRRKENSKTSKKCPTFPRLQVCPITNSCYLNNVNIYSAGLFCFIWGHRAIICIRYKNGVRRE